MNSSVKSTQTDRQIVVVHCLVLRFRGARLTIVLRSVAVLAALIVGTRSALLTLSLRELSHL